MSQSRTIGKVAARPTDAEVDAVLDKVQGGAVCYRLRVLSSEVAAYPELETLVTAADRNRVKKLAKKPTAVANVENSVLRVVGAAEMIYRKGKIAGFEFLRWYRGATNRGATNV